MGQGQLPCSVRIFLSSTYEDLKPYVHAAEEVLRTLHVEVDQFKHWEATGRPSARECKERVRACDALIVLVGKTYGWVPRLDEGGDGRTSITRFEVQWARETPMPVLPFFIHEAAPRDSAASPDTARLLAEFVAELQATLAKPVPSLEAFRENLRQSVVAFIGTYRGATARSTQIGLRTQGLYRQFLDRDDSRRRLHSALTHGEYRGAVIVGRGGLGKSALANRVIEQLRENGAIERVIYLNSARQTPIDAFGLFMATMEASGTPRVVYEGSWAALNSNRQRLIEVLLEVYQQHQILLLFDAFEHNLDEAGDIRSPGVGDFVRAFLEGEHLSKLLITTRQFPALSATEAARLDEIQLNRGLPTSDAVALLMSQLPEGIPQLRDRVEAAVKAVDGIPFAVERMAYLLRKDRLLDVGRTAVHEKTLDSFVALAHSTLSADAHMTLQARSVFDEEVSADALTMVLEGHLTPAAVESAIEELGRGNFLFQVGSEGLLGLHEFDKESSYRSIEHDGTLDRRYLHVRAAAYYARQCEDRESWFDWTSYDELRGDLNRFHHLVNAGETVQAANAFSVSKVEFLIYAGHVEEIQRMFAGLDVGSEPTRALLVKRYALADCLAVIGPFDRAIIELKEVIALAQELGETAAELSARYELGGAYRYNGQGEEAVQMLRFVTDRLRERSDYTSLAYCLYGHSLACSYAGQYAEAIRLGQEQVRYGRRSGKSYFVGRGNSSLCLAYHLIGEAREAATCAAASAREFLNTPNEYMVGFIENVHGLALHALGRGAEAVDAFSRGREIGRRTVQRRVEGLVAVNWAWVLYDQGDLDGALSHIGEAIRVFEEISKETDLRLSHHLREAFEFARDADHRYEADALANFVSSDYVNADLIQRATVAKRILSLGSDASPQARQAAESLLDVTERRLDAGSDEQGI